MPEPAPSSVKSKNNPLVTDSTDIEATAGFTIPTKLPMDGKVVELCRADREAKGVLGLGGTAVGEFTIIEDGGVEEGSRSPMVFGFDSDRVDMLLHPIIRANNTSRNVRFITIFAITILVVMVWLSA